MGYEAVFPLPVPKTIWAPRNLHFLWEGANAICDVVRNGDRMAAENLEFGRIGFGRIEAGEITNLAAADCPALEVVWANMFDDPGSGSFQGSADDEAGQSASETTNIEFLLNAYVAYPDRKKNAHAMMNIAAFLFLLFKHFNTLNGWCPGGSLFRGVQPAETVFKKFESKDQLLVVQGVQFGLRALYDWRALSHEDGGQTARTAVHPGGPDS